MAASLTFFPVGNGDMALVKLDNGQTILVDINIRASADDPDDDTPDVAQDLKDRLSRDEKGRLYVDAFLLSHPDADHVTGLRNHFHLGSPEDFPEDNDELILIREMWSSPIVFRRASSQHPLCDDAKAWATEARRRVKMFREKGLDGTGSGDRILILGKDKDGKTDDIMDIVVQQDGLLTKANRVDEAQFEARLLAPMCVDEDDEELIDVLAENNSSAILRFSLKGDGYTDKCRFLTGGDADVTIWERLWLRHKDSNRDWLSYDVMETPHHCSWRSLSYDRWSEMGEDVKVCEEARSALSQTREGAIIVASCKPIKKDDDNPPHERAKREYVSITSSDRFICTTEYHDENQRPLEFSISGSGMTKVQKLALAKAAALVGVTGVTTVARAHG
ncbi:metallohydrolase [Mesorhizobium abyssinicae]|uniref:Metallohydrolase n=1 Tax=Mesorhizobium abyssinicae TaxID=1209958 RepID=A0ABU5AU97_9HYPH|nr:metallohydrolase [Mesorhizobium abyssinicae]MDX8540782.1 metallohydrolase [Mesorhizobium abyssinicae]